MLKIIVLWYRTRPILITRITSKQQYILSLYVYYSYVEMQIVRLNTTVLFASLTAWSMIQFLFMFIHQKQLFGWLGQCNDIPPLHKIFYFWTDRPPNIKTARIPVIYAIIKRVGKEHATGFAEVSKDWLFLQVFSDPTRNKF